MATKSSKPARSATQIESDLASARSRLTSSIELLIDQVHPNRVKQRESERLREFIATKRQYAQSQLNRARSQFVDEGGNWRTDRLMLVGGSLTGVAALVLIVRTIAARGRK